VYVVQIFAHSSPAKHSQEKRLLLQLVHKTTNPASFPQQKCHELPVSISHVAQLYP